MTTQRGAIGPQGSLNMAIIPNSPAASLSPATPGYRRATLGWKIKNNLRLIFIWGYLTTKAAKLFTRITGIPTITSELRLKKIEYERPRTSDELKQGIFAPIRTVIDYGVVSRRIVTDTGAQFIVDAFQNTVELEIMRYHGIGTGSTAEVVGNTALETELTTQYNPDNTRATGTQTENGANVYQTVGTNSVDASVSLREHGILSQAATGGGVLLDRHTYALISLSAGDSLQSTYDFQVNSGG